MDNLIHAIHYIKDLFFIPNVTFYKCDLRFDVRIVEIHDIKDNDVTIILLQEIADEINTEESGTTGDENFHVFYLRCK